MDVMCRYDYLEFTDVAGNKTRFDHKVNTDKWPLTKLFSAGPRLHFLFHSDSSNNEWGYKFRVQFCNIIFIICKYCEMIVACCCLRAAVQTLNIYWYVGCTGFGYFISSRSRTWPDLGTQIQSQLDPDLEENLFWDHRTIPLMKLMVSAMLSAAIKRQYSSVLPLLHVCQCLTKFVEGQFVFLLSWVTLIKIVNTTWQVRCVSFIHN